MEIKTRKELREILNYENKCRHLPEVKSALGWVKADLKYFIHPGSPRMYMYGLRCEEYWMRKKWAKLITALLRSKRRKLSFRTGISLYPNVADIGVTVNHGKCVVSKFAKIGRDCVILSDVTIGEAGGSHGHGAPVIGQRVLISSGARIIGEIKIADGVVVGANAVVTKDILEPNITVGGIPAKKIGEPHPFDEFIKR